MPTNKYTLNLSCFVKWDHHKMKYWDPITCNPQLASIDWCEINYQVSDYIVEFWNTLSSFSFVAVGILNIYVLSKINGIFIEKFISWLYIIVGIGSAAFHGTLKFNYQLWDEIPMVWVISSYNIYRALYAYFTLFSPKKTKLQVFVFFVIYDLFWMYIHTYNGFVVLFQVNFISMYFIMVGVMVTKN